LTSKQNALQDAECALWQEAAIVWQGSATLWQGLATLWQRSAISILAFFFLGFFPVFSPEAHAQASQDHVVILLDGSGSMADKMRGGAVKMDAAKTAIAQVLNQLPADTEVGLLVFSTLHRDPWIVQFGPKDNADFRAKLSKVRPKGGTPLGEYMKVATDRLLKARSDKLGYGTYRLLVVTDGRAGDAQLVDAFAPQIRSRNITLDVIGVAMDRDHMLKRTASSYRRADDAASLERAVSEVLAEVPAVGGNAQLAYEEAFDLLSGIPDEMAMTMLQGITTVNNEPLNTRRQASRSTSQQSRPYQPGPNQPYQAPNQSSRGSKFPFWLVLLIVFFVLPNLLKIFKD